MPEHLRWWHDRPAERFWLESTNRPDIGADLKAPLADTSGRENWRYTLFRETRAGDIVFHYNTDTGAIVAVSRIAGTEQLRPIVWAARGTYARERRAEPEEVPGYFIPLEGHRPLPAPLTLGQLRNTESQIRKIHNDLRATTPGPLYFPFELSDRPLRVMQGYAFKLPAAFVAAFDQLAGAAATVLPKLPVANGPPPEHRAPPLSPVRSAVAAIEAAAPGYEIGKLQALRRELRQLKRSSTRRLFSDRSPTEKWAFHSGGRDELQFNVGEDEYPDGSKALRGGVAFSFETSRSMPSLDALVPKVSSFNHFMRANPRAFADLAMWHWDDSKRSPDYPPTPIAPELVHGKMFIFLGCRQPLDTPDAHQILKTFDRLLPLYRHIESQDSSARETTESAETFQLDRGITTKPSRWSTANYVERTLNIFLRHNELQEQLRTRLVGRGFEVVKLEVPIGQRSVDVVVQHGNNLWFYEIKTADTVRQCLREAIGQLLEYALWPGATRPTRLIVVGEPALSSEAELYLRLLNIRFPIELEYEQITLAG